MLNIDTKEYDLTLGNIIVKLFIESSDTNGMNFINVHQNEVTSKEAGRHITQELGGRMLYITHGDGTSRNVTFCLNGGKYEFDPNRMFDDVGAENSLKEFGDFSEEALKVVRNFAGKILDFLLPGHNHIIALHNNYNSPSYSFKSYFSLPFSNDVLKIYPEQCPEKEIGEFFYITIENWFDALKQKEIFNLVLQNNETVEDDGSLSVYAGENNIQYSNVEAEHGNLDQQISMLSALHSVLFPDTQLSV
ncbi:MAG TPA: hypothetical protein DEQ74_03305 [Wolbachia sp.]|jgi:hypothetical protein|uniref:hypothetical protein n=1 Tax=Wolbachia endosymbiont of Pentalonia nigronervosa TaxID=1301914 RepID=UPI000ED5A618|nr:hypothetical protein [Wolbachia endosymbiont of Pentalonia nigronervosa]MBD0391845.1 hypothetical protein [Wolbachia endosymbiont of Pentalonia nigronervosa]HCE59828.1 hypothetical protein [Wolbachia sp.]